MQMVIKREVSTNIRKIGINEKLLLETKRTFKNDKRVHQEDLRSVNIHVLESRVPKYTKQDKSPGQTISRPTNPNKFKGIEIIQQCLIGSIS